MHLTKYWERHLARVGIGETYTGFWWAEPNGKNILVKPGRRLEYKIKVDLQEVGCESTTEWRWIRISVDIKEKLKPSKISYNKYLTAQP